LVERRYLTSHQRSSADLAWLGDLAAGVDQRPDQVVATSEPYLTVWLQSPLHVATLLV
jgi:hypothetical protein